MAIADIQGVLSIDLVDVYQWLQSRGVETNGANKLEFSPSLNALVLTFVDGRTTEVGSEEFWTWVIDKQLPAGIAAFETAFGLPVVCGDDGYCLQVSFAASNCCDPRTWSKPPACLAEWEQSTAVALRESGVIT